MCVCRHECAYVSTHVGVCGYVRWTLSTFVRLYPTKVSPIWYLWEFLLYCRVFPREGSAGTSYGGSTHPITSNADLTSLLQIERRERRHQERKTTAAMLLSRMEDRKHERTIRALGSDLPAALADQVQAALSLSGGDGVSNY